MIYLNDILIYLNNMSEHYQYVKKVLKYLCKAGLYAKVKKYKFYSKSVEYLRYILSSGLTMSNDKVKIIQDWLKSKKVKNIQSFLSFANFYHQFIFNYSDIIILFSPERMSSKSLTSLVMILSTLLRRYLPLLLFSLTGFLIFNLL